MPNTRTKEEIINEFTKYCEDLGFGTFEVEVLDGLPKKITSAKQSVRLDIKSDYQDTTMK